jgi:hypothetical protein
LILLKKKQKNSWNLNDLGKNKPKVIVHICDEFIRSFKHGIVKIIWLKIGISLRIVARFCACASWEAS